MPGRSMFSSSAIPQADRQLGGHGDGGVEKGDAQAANEVGVVQQIVEVIEADELAGEQALIGGPAAEAEVGGEQQRQPKDAGHQQRCRQHREPRELPVEPFAASPSGHGSVSPLCRVHRMAGVYGGSLSGLGDGG